MNTAWKAEAYDPPQERLKRNDALMRVCSEQELRAAVTAALEEASILCRRLAEAGDGDSCRRLGTVQRLLDAVEDRILQRDAGRRPLMRISGGEKGPWLLP